MSLRVVFMGTPDFSVPMLRAILNAGHNVVASYSQPPRRAGRGKKIAPTPVHAFAQEAGIEVRHPVSLKPEDEQAAFAELNVDVACVVAYGLLLPKPVLSAPNHGCLNLHASLLPRWRGAAPLNRAIMAGDTETGAMVMRMEEGLDTGPVCLTHREPIPSDMTAGELHDTLSEAGAALMVEALAKLDAGTLTCTPQSCDDVTYAKKIDKSEARIDWSETAQTVHNQIRGLSPFPGAWFEANGERIKALASTSPTNDKQAGRTGTLSGIDGTVVCGTGSLRLVTVQRAGRKPQPFDEFLRGFDLTTGTELR